ncbi:MAG TPA: efflux RND transporter periplasmic adaptor subunit [Candidatus Ozemobacteraceae bacterium]|nr:efflux RND transporter periplasmic adaptor subunit [Candidatus Ozemobacteraceae bacterium]
MKLNTQMHHSQTGFKKLCRNLILWSALSLLIPVELPAQNGNGVAIPVFAEKVTTGTINRRIETSGDILPLLGVNVHPEAAGRITEIFVDVGSNVKKGQELAQIYNDVQKAQLQQAQAAVTVSKAAIEMQKVMVETTQSALVAAKAGVEAAESQLKNLAITRERLEKLFSEGAISRQQLDDVVAQHDSASARLIAAKSEEKRAGDAIQSAKMTLEMRRAELIQATANLNSVQVLLDNTLVRAPFDGVITARHADPGAMAGPAVPLFRIEQINPAKILGTIIEKDLYLIEAGRTPAIITVDAVREESRGVVSRIYPAIDSNSRTGRIEILLQNPELKLRSGMFAKISLLINTSEDKPVVGRDALLKYENNYYAYLIENGHAVKRQVKVGIIDEDRVEVVEGLKPGDLIISKGLEFIREGSAVKVSEGDGNK